MKKKKYLPLYYKWLSSEELPKDGLCKCFGERDKLFKLMTPDAGYVGGYWAFYYDVYGRPVMTQDVGDREKYLIQYTFNPLRQNIVLLMAAMNNEL